MQSNLCEYFGGLVFGAALVPTLAIYDLIGSISRSKSTPTSCYKNLEFPGETTVSIDVNTNLEKGSGVFIDVNKNLTSLLEVFIDVNNNLTSLLEFPGETTVS